MVIINRRLVNAVSADCHDFSETVEHLWQGWRTFLRARAEIFDNFWRNSFACPWEF
jgi:hypothetical protein